MTDQNYTHITLVLDMSGSMTSLSKDLIGGVNTFLQEQKAMPEKLTISQYRFDTAIERDYHVADSALVADLTEEIYKPRGMTALIDACCIAIDETGQQLANMPEHARPGKVIFLIYTDGAENSSCQYTTHHLSQRITTQESEFNWDFLFLGAHADAFSQARSYGVKTGKMMRTSASADGLDIGYRAVSDRVFRSRYNKLGDLQHNEDERDDAVGYHCRVINKRCCDNCNYNDGM